MRSAIALRLIPLCLVLTFFVSACGGGGGSSLSEGSGVQFSGNTQNAEITDSNVEEIGGTAGEAVRRADLSSDVPVGIVAETDNNLRDLISPLIEQQAQLNALTDLPSAITVDVSDETCISGRAVVSSTSSTLSGPLTINATYTNCLLIGGYGYTYNGRIVAHYNNYPNLNAGYSVRVSNFSISGGLVNATNINMTMDCSDADTCTYSSDFVGLDGEIHRVSEYEITGSDALGYDGSAVFYHGAYGKVSIVASSLTYGNCGYLPDGGTITLTSANGSSATINFASNCTLSGTWSNGSVSGSF